MIQYCIGDATQPIGEGNKIIPHICNDIGGWGKGFVLALSKRWKQPEQAYREWYESQKNFELGQVQFVEVEPDLVVANIIGQKGIQKSGGKAPIRYEAVKEGLAKIAIYAQDKNASIHMPRIGSGLAGGKWEVIEKIIQEELIVKDIEVTVYALG
jgi:O-acetyl-ADP-ribose deacetylase (regulator of RNase III)